MKNLAFRTPQERRELLQEVMLQAETSGMVESVRGDQYERQNTRNQKGGHAAPSGPIVKRTAGSLADLGGGQDMAYVEYASNRNAELKKGGKKAKGHQSELFKKMDRERERKRKQQEGIS